MIVRAEIGELVNVLSWGCLPSLGGDRNKGIDKWGRLENKTETLETYPPFFLCPWGLSFSNFRSLTYLGKPSSPLGFSVAGIEAQKHLSSETAVTYPFPGTGGWPGFPYSASFSCNSLDKASAK